MIKFKISYKNPLIHLIDVEAVYPNLNEDFILLNLAAWRPGRYELANYAKNMFKVKAYDVDGNLLSIQKTLKDQWRIETKCIGQIKVLYSYYAFQMDAGNSFLDDEQLYVNPINCLLYDKERMFEECELKIEVPELYKIACGLKEIGIGRFVAKDFYELADSPFIASPSLKRLEYQAEGVNFNVWIQGDHLLNEERILKDFKKFSDYQIKMMGNFPEKDYHFLFQILPYAFRHGVEHGNSTVITMGPAAKIDNELYADLLGISSHELFHAWNILKIRPKELMPYDFSKENYFKTGYVAEGITTYYGDLLLARAGVFSLDQFFFEFNDLLNKHFNTSGNTNLSVADSSFDLWLDGYVPGVPGRKVSIYTKGAIVALIIDVALRRLSSNGKSLDDAMKLLWNNFGFIGKGYSDEDFIKTINEVANQDLSLLINKCVNESTDLMEEVKNALDFLGLELKIIPCRSFLERFFGIRTIVVNGKTLVDLIDSEAEGYDKLSKNDEIVAVNSKRYEQFLYSEEKEIEIMFFRGSKLLKEKLTRNDTIYFPQYSAGFKSGISTLEKESFEKWLNITH